jgi:hypothetical protein
LKWEKGLEISQRKANRVGSGAIQDGVTSAGRAMEEQQGQDVDIG